MSYRSLAGTIRETITKVKESPTMVSDSAVTALGVDLVEDVHDMTTSLELNELPTIDDITAYHVDFVLRGKKEDRKKIAGTTLVVGESTKDAADRAKRYYAKEFPNMTFKLIEARHAVITHSRRNAEPEWRYKSATGMSKSRKALHVNPL